MTNGFYLQLDETRGSGQNGALESFNGKFRDDADRVRREASTDQRSSRFRNGLGRCATWGPMPRIWR